MDPFRNGERLAPSLTQGGPRIGSALKLLVLVFQQRCKRDRLGNRPAIDHFRLTLFDVDDQISPAVLMVYLGREGAWAEQRRLILHLLQFGHHLVGVGRFGAFDGLSPDIDEHVAGIDILARRVAAGRRSCTSC